jgi:hypothetical protein
MIALAITKSPANEAKVDALDERDGVPGVRAPE